MFFLRFVFCEKKKSKKQIVKTIAVASLIFADPNLTMPLNAGRLHKTKKEKKKTEFSMTNSLCLPILFAHAPRFHQLAA